MISRTRLGGLALPLIVAACGTGMVAYTPIQQKTKYPEDSLFQAASGVLESKGHPLTDRDPTTFKLVTREKEVAISTVPMLSYKYQYTVVTQGGTLSITTTCTQNSEFKRTEFEDCGNERPLRVVEETNEIKEAILERAKSMK